MDYSGICPLCSREIPSERIIGGQAICECGYCDNSIALKEQRRRDMQIAKLFVFMAFVISVSYIHVMNWGSYSGSIVFLKMGEIVDALSPESTEKLIDACIAQNHWSCAETAHMELYKKTQNPEVLARLGRFETLLKNLPQAANAYEAYYKVGGKNPDVPFFYAQVLEQLGRNDQALTYYQMSIDQNPTKLSANATSSLVHILMKEQKYAQARDIVTNFHGSAENAKGYLNFEESELIKILGTEKPRAKRVAGR